MKKLLSLLLAIVLSVCLVNLNNNTAKAVPTVTVSFDMQGHGTQVNAQTLAAGECAMKPGNPSEEGYRFDGWYQEAGCTTPWDFTTPVTTDKTLYAKWTPSYTVTFDMQGHGTQIDPQIVVSGSKVEKPDNPTELGYTFDGWYQEAACENLWNFDTDTVSADTTLYAKWNKLFTITATEDGTKVKLAKTGTVSSNLQYTDGVNPWTDYTYDNEITLNKGKSISFKAKTNVALSIDSDNYVKVVVSAGKITASGNIMSLVDGTNFVTNVTIPDTEDGFCFFELFKDCTRLTSIDGLKLPATTLKQRCYYRMFEGCTGLTSVPSNLLPATTLTYLCYANMFKGCTGLTSVPSNLLPATSLDSSCYQLMFAGCTNLTNIPDLPATTLKAYCYQSMFYGCSKLKVSETKTGNYQIKLHIPGSANDATKDMFTSTGGAFKGTPSFNTDYYIATKGSQKAEECTGTSCSISAEKGTENIVAHIDVTDLTPAAVVSVLQFDGEPKKLIKGVDYDLYTGSLTFVLNKSFIDTLGVGSHSIKISYVISDYGYVYNLDITITDNSSTVSSNKDESCEKVIGPTWHWNNTKGVCEEYALVRTYTR